MHPALDLETLLNGVVAAAREAGEAILEVYATDFAVRGKDDASPVTVADERAEALILRRLAALTPNVPVVAEEAVAAGHVPDVSGGGSGSSTRSTAPRSSSAATASSPSTSP